MCRLRTELRIGSPPPMRGKANAVGLLHLGFRITPAYAGKSRKVIISWQRFQDHPRLCGEKFDQLFNIMCTIGSPPPMRGKAIMYFCWSMRTRITPAYAGKSTCGVMHRASPWDHPRLCGEKTFCPATRFKTLGSPPPMRGKAVRHFQHPL